MATSVTVTQLLLLLRAAWEALARGPGVGGFTTRRERAVASESAVRSLDTRSHEPLEM